MNYWRREEPDPSTYFSIRPLPKKAHQCKDAKERARFRRQKRHNKRNVGK